MKIVEGSKAPKREETGGIFTGTVKMKPLIEREDSSEYRAAVVTFPPGVRNHFHSHTHDQILFVVGGRGIVATEEDERVVNVGDTILFPAGENHWHGATKDSEFSHLYVVNKESKTSY